MGVMEEPIEDGIRDGGLTDPAVPVLDGQLRGDDGAPRAMRSFSSRRGTRAYEALDEDALRVLDSLSMREAGDEPRIQATALAGIEVFEACLAMLQTCLGYQAYQPSIAAVSSLPLHQQREAILERERVARGQRDLLFEGMCHAIEF